MMEMALAERMASIVQHHIFSTELQLLESERSRRPPFPNCCDPIRSGPILAEFLPLDVALQEVRSEYAAEAEVMQAELESASARPIRAARDVTSSAQRKP